MSKIYLITGTSSGFGRALAQAVLKRGDKAVLAAQKLADIEELAAQYKDNALAVKLDVTNQNDRQQAIASAINKFGRVDVLANIANGGRIHHMARSWRRHSV